MCGLTIVLLLFPGTALDAAWRLNPEAQRSFQSSRVLSIALMAVVGASCGTATFGLFRGAQWGRVLALVILSVNVLADAANAIVRHDYRALIGIPIGGLMILYLLNATYRRV
jgi:hypothetical protein